MDYESWLEEAADIAEKASEVALSFFRQALLIEMKDNGTPVTNADKKTEMAIRDALAISFPDHGVYGEEFGEEKKGSKYVWTIDPIDGTRSFMRGIPLFGTLLALIEDGEPVIGIMVLPAIGETYVAAKGVGAYCNGTRLQVSPVTTLESAFVACGDTSCFDTVGKMSYLQALQKKTEECRGYTDCFGHSLVMRGALDAMVDPIVNLWDVAPLACLIKEAGGNYFTFEGTETHVGPSFISCSTPQLKDELLRLG